ncbi:MAG: hypothetical protein IKD22_05615 [Lentisphaeria bacterium]|nr:hypothetical protein [Lentisphaeria bacterium]
MENQEQNQDQNQEQEKLSPELKLQLLMAEKEVEENMSQSNFNIQRAALNGVLCLIAFFVVGLLCKAPLGSAIGFGVIGGIVGIMVGGVRKLPPPQK